MPKKFFTVVIVTFSIIYCPAQNPFKHWTETFETRYSSSQPIVNYVLSIDSNDFSSFAVDMIIKNIPDTFQVAMVAHPEYDDRYWRYVEDLVVDAKNGKGNFIRQDSSLWKIMTNGREAVLHYRIRPSSVSGTRSAWKAYLAPTGGLVGGPHSFMYVVGATLIPSHVSFHIPRDWEIVTGLQSTSAPMTFYSPSVFTLIDDPVFIGRFKSWSFTTDHVPHRVTYWSLPGAKQFDTSALVSSIEKIVRQALLVFGRTPYREFNFMLQDGAVGALEHNNSITVGAPASQLANDVNSILPEIAHEYFHTWNLMRIHPVEYGDVSYKTPPLSKGLWFSEGLTIFYSDLLLRRAGLPVFDSTRLFHLENLVRRYSASPVYTKFNAEKISESSYGPVGMLGDYTGSTHLQGEVLGAMLDLVIRNASNGTRTIDDLMRKMMEKFSGQKGFTSKDIEQAVKDVCGYDVRQFFNDHVYGTRPIDFGKYLALIGLQYTSEWKDVLSNEHNPVPDMRVFLYQSPGESIFRLGLSNPTALWGRSGFHTGDILKTINGKTVSSIMDFRTIQRNAKIGDTLAVEIERSSGVQKINVLVTGYQQPVIRITPIPAATEKQKRLYQQWYLGK